MSKLHLKFKNIREDVLEATEEFFVSKPWEGSNEEKQQKFDYWLAKVSEAYGVETPGLEVVEGNPMLQLMVMAYQEGMIYSRKYSIINTFIGFRRHCQVQGAVTVDPDKQQEDCAAWACSLFYKLRPFMFRKGVREGKIMLMHPRFLLADPDTFVDTGPQRYEPVGEDDELTSSFNQLLAGNGLLDAEEDNEDDA